MQTGQKEFMMAKILKIVQAQLNQHVGDIWGNVQNILAAQNWAASCGADLVLTPELSVLGYPGKDLCTDPDVLAEIEQAIAHLCAASKNLGAAGPALVVGAPLRLAEGSKITNSALFIHDGQVLARVDKQNRPDYGVFNEKRLFAQGAPSQPVRFRDVMIGIMICEDGWFEDNSTNWSEDYRDVAQSLKNAGAELVLWPNASPFALGKQTERLAEVVTRRAKETGLAFFYTNQVGGQDELIFDGASMVVDGTGACILQQPTFVTDSSVITWADHKVSTASPSSLLPLVAAAEAYQATVLAVRDYVQKQGFKSVILGLSGGIDSALTAAIAVDALGPQAVHAVRLPSRYTSNISNDDAVMLAHNLGLPDTNLLTIPIEDACDASRNAIRVALAESTGHTLSAGLADENLQARVRGQILMYLSNECGHLLLSTGNKSELSVGYSTLYGDMCGGFAVLKDMYKTMVFACARWRNNHHLPWFCGPAGAVIPERTIVRPPSAELRNDQTDAASLGAYEHLDFVLEGINEDRLPLKQVAALFFNNFSKTNDNLRVPDHETALAYSRKVHRMLQVNEYKRYQYAPGPRLTRYGLGAGDRDYPITDGSKNWRYR